MVRNSHVIHQQTTTMLSWKEALAILEDTDAKGAPTPFSVRFCTADESRGTGGEIIDYEKAVWHVAGGRLKPGSEQPSRRRWTRNIRAVGSDQIRKLHVHLILEINGHPIR